MRAGLLTEIIEVLRPTTITNDYGEKKQDFSLYLTTRAVLEHLRGSRNIENSEIVHNYTKVFSVRIYNDIDEKDVIRWNGKEYRILDIEPDKKKQQLTITTELINDGTRQ